MKVQDVMSKQVVTVGPETPLKDVAAILSEHAISGLPVVDFDGRVVGVVSEGDILVKTRASMPDRGALYAVLHAREAVETELKLDARTAAEAMTTPVVTIRPTRPLAEAAAIMIDRGVNRLPVVDGGKLVGILTRADLVRAFTRGDAEIAGEIRDDVVLKTFWIPPEEVAVDVHCGAVTLRGEIEMRSDAELLPDFVRRVPGVVSVTSQLTWRTDNRSADWRDV